MSVTKMYSVLDKWTDLEKENIVDFTSVDGTVTQARLNGVPVGGGGGDFSIATVSATGDISIDLYCNFINENQLGYAPSLSGGDSVDIPIYKNGTVVYIEASGVFSISGSIEQTSSSYYLISGNCTLAAGGSE